MRAVRSSLVAVLTLGLAVAAFGPNAGADSTLNKKQYLKAGNGICDAASTEFQAMWDELDAQGGGEPTPEQLEWIIGREVVILRTMFDGLETLKGPKPLTKKVGALLDKFGALVDDIEADPASIDENTAPYRKSGKKIKKLGLTRCPPPNA